MNSVDKPIGIVPAPEHRNTIVNNTLTGTSTNAMGYIILKLSRSQPLPDGRNTIYHYDTPDGNEAFRIESSDTAWSYKTYTNSPRLAKIQDRILGKFIANEMRQHEFAGGFYQAVSLLLVRIDEEEI